jgi:tetratricopeptide (TPR) repeat protein
MSVYTEICNGLRKGKIILVLGVDFSSPMGYPVKEDLSRALRANFPNANLHSMQFDQIVGELLSRGVNRDKIEETVLDSLRPDEAKQNQNPYKLLAKLMEKCSKPIFIFTANWDSEIDYALCQYKVLTVTGHEEVSTSIQKLKQEKFEAIVVKMHGDAISKNLILTEKDALEALQKRKSMYVHFSGKLSEYGLVIMGHGMLSRDIIEFRKMIRECNPNPRDYLVMLRDNPFSDVTHIHEDALVFLRELHKSLTCEDPIKSVPLNVDGKIRRTISQSKPLLVSGCKYCGKTSLRLRLGPLDKYDAIDIPYTSTEEDYSSVKRAVEHFETGRQRPPLVLLSHNHLRFFKARYKEETDKELFECMKNIDLQITKEEARDILLKICIEDQRIADYLSRHDLCDKIIGYSNFQASRSPRRRYTTYLPPLIAELAKRLTESKELKSAFEGSNPNEELIWELFDKETALLGECDEHSKALCEALVLPDSVVLAEADAAFEVAGKSLDFLSKGAGFLGGLLLPAVSAVPFVNVAGLGIAGASLLFGILDWRSGNKDSPLWNLVKASSHWNALGETEKRVIAYRFELKGHLEPETGYDYLESLLGGNRSLEIGAKIGDYLKGNPSVWEEFLASEAGKTFKEQSVLVVMDNLCKTLENRFSQIDERIKAVEVKINQHDEKISKILEDITKMKEVIAGIKEDVGKIRTGFEEVRKEPSFHLSYLYVSFDDVPIHKLYDLMDIAVNVELYFEDGKKKKLIPFVTSESLEELMDLDEGLFISGPSGSGKSRILVEAITRKETNKKGLFFVGNAVDLNRTGSELQKYVHEPFEIKEDIPLEELVKAVEAKAKTAERKGLFLVWNNFPIGLMVSSRMGGIINEDDAKSVLGLLSSLNRERVRTLFTLDPQYYAQFSEITKDVTRRRNIILLRAVNVKYDEKVFGRLFVTLGKTILGDQAYSERIGETNESEIVKELYRKETQSAPQFIKEYFVTVKKENYNNTKCVVFAVEFTPKNFKKRYAEQLQATSEKYANDAGIDFLYSVKIAELFAEENTQESISNLQNAIFKTNTENPFLNLWAWFRQTSGRYLIEDLKMEALEDVLNSDGYALGKVFSFIREHGGFYDFFESRKKQGQEWFERITSFIAQREDFCDPSDFLAAIMRITSSAFDPENVLSSTGEASSSSAQASWIATGLGKVFCKLSEELKAGILNLARENRFLACGLGLGIGASLGDFSPEARDEVFELARKNNFPGDSRYTKIVREIYSSREEVHAAIQKLAKIHPDNLELTKRARFYSSPLVTISDIYAGDEVHESYIFLGGLGRGVGISLRRFDPQIRHRIYELARESGDFADELGTAGEMFMYICDLGIQRELLKLTRTSASKRFASKLGLKIGVSLNEVDFQVLTEVFKTAEEVEHFGLSLGFGIGLQSSRLSPKLLCKISKLARENINFERGLASGVAALISMPAYHHLSLSLMIEKIDDFSFIQELEGEVSTAFSPYILCANGLISESKGDLKHAVEFFEKSLNANPELDKAKERLERIAAKIVQETEILSDAEAICGNLEKIDFKAAASAYDWLGEALDSMGRLTDAEVEFTRAIELDNDKAWYYEHRAYCRARMQNSLITMAEEDIIKAVQLFPSSPSVWVTFAKIYALRGLKGRALKILDEALQGKSIKLEELLREVSEDLGNSEVSLSEKQLLKEFIEKYSSFT